MQHQGDAVVGVDRAVDLAGQSGEHRPGEGVAGGLLAVERQHAYGDVDRVGGQLEAALEVGAGHRLRQQHRAGLVDRDPQVLDVVDGEVEPGRQARRRRAQHRQVGTDRRQAQDDDVSHGTSGQPAARRADSGRRRGLALRHAPSEVCRLCRRSSFARFRPLGAAGRAGASHRAERSYVRTGPGCTRPTRSDGRLARMVDARARLPASPA